MDEERIIQLKGSDNDENKPVTIQFHYVKGNKAVTFALNTNWYIGKKIKGDPKGHGLILHTTDPNIFPDGETSLCMILGGTCYTKIISDGRDIAENFLESCCEELVWFELENIFEEYFENK